MVSKHKTIHKRVDSIVAWSALTRLVTDSICIANKLSPVEYAQQVLRQLDKSNYVMLTHAVAVKNMAKLKLESTCESAYLRRDVIKTFLLLLLILLLLLQVLHFTTITVC